MKYPYSGLLVNHKKEWGVVTCCNTDKPRKHYAKCKKATQKAMYFMIPFMWNIQKRQIHRDRKYVSGCQTWGKEGTGMDYLMYTEFLFGMMKSSGTRFWWQLHTVNILNATTKYIKIISVVNFVLRILLHTSKNAFLQECR